VFTKSPLDKTDEITCPSLAIIVNNSFADSSISLKFCTEFGNVTRDVLQTSKVEVKDQGHNVMTAKMF